MCEKITLSKQNWDQILLQSNEKIDQAQSLQKQYKFCCIKKYGKSTVDYQIQKAVNSKLNVIQGQVTIKSSLNKLLAFDMEEREINPHMHSNQRRGRLCKYWYYPDQSTRDKIGNIRNEIPNEDLLFLMYQITESGFPIVDNREFVTLRKYTKLQSDVVVTTASVEADVQFYEKQSSIVKCNITRGHLTNINTYHDNLDGSIQVTAFTFGDPCGHLPAAMYNFHLEKQMQFLVNMKKVCEEK